MLVVESRPYVLSGVTIDNPSLGTWHKYTFPKGEMYLHERLGFEVATTLSLWDYLNSDTKITKDEHDQVIGVVRRIK